MDLYLQAHITVHESTTTKLSLCNISRPSRLPGPLDGNLCSACLKGNINPARGIFVSEKIAGLHQDLFFNLCCCFVSGDSGRGDSQQGMCH